MFLRLTDATNDERVCVNFDEVRIFFRVTDDAQQNVTALLWRGLPDSDMALVRESASAIAATLDAREPVQSQGDQR